MKTQNDKKEIKLKDGTIFPLNTECTLVFNTTAICEVVTADRTFKTRCANLPHWFSDIERPTMEELEEANLDGICPSILGESVEPDGWDCDKSPSWLIALGLI